ncbi:putative reticulon nogo receptor [Trypoxylus dichotomus]
MSRLLISLAQTFNFSGRYVMIPWKRCKSSSLQYNKLLCDCRLEWLYKLKNESKNQETRNILEELTCYSKTDGAIQLVSEAPDEYDVTAPYSDDYNDNYVNRQDDSPSRLQNPNQRRFLEIPPERLPCPKKQENTESPYLYLNTPKYAEINSGSNDSQFCVYHILVLIICYITFT